MDTEFPATFDAMLANLTHALDGRDGSGANHGANVAELTVHLARALGIPESELIHYERGARLHDIGKVRVPETILLKPGSLTDQEFQIVRRHTTFGFEMLAPIELLRVAADIALAHHEHWDGSGYPRGLRGEAIPLPARVFAVVDVWDAVTSDRPYRGRWTRARAMEHIRALAGTQFDPKITRVFLEIIPDHFAME
ncbi:MAG: HD-GYP domain-containing protein [Chloroflexi bacterium]|nr:HD-GYP domain-containing protein [Chloroflexota bacterium]